MGGLNQEACAACCVHCVSTEFVHACLCFSGVCVTASLSACLSAGMLCLCQSVCMYWYVCMFVCLSALTETARTMPDESCAVTDRVKSTRHSISIKFLLWHNNKNRSQEK